MLNWKDGWKHLTVAVLIGLALEVRCARASDSPNDSTIYTDEWAVYIDGGSHVAEMIAEKHGFINLGKIFGDYYHFKHNKVAKRSIETSSHHHELLNNEPEIRWAQQQVIKRRVKRSVSIDDQSNPRLDGLNHHRNRKIRSTFTGMFNLNDPGWRQMWYLNRGNGRDMNVQEVWAEGITGKGVVVTILDDGLEKDHPDLSRNYDPMASFDVNDFDEDPSPRYDIKDSNRHGTRCAGEVAAQSNNTICAVGVAFDAKIGGVRMLDGDVTDAVEARSLSFNSQHIDIYSASWGPDDDGKTVDGPGELATRAFMEGVLKGRGGKGSIFVWASGNGGKERDNCNCDGYTNSIWTLSISSATENGSVPWYSEACSSTLATAYSSGSAGQKQIVTTDLHHSCTPTHTGTSAAAPLAAGICALTLEANRNLTWRDMQHIVVRTAKPDHLVADDWQVNGVGRKVSHSFGYGLLDAAAMVKLARTWQSVASQQFCQVRAPSVRKTIAPMHSIKLQLIVAECPNVNVMEHLQAVISLSATNRGDIQIHLMSPAGTRSTLLARRPLDNSHNGFHSWPFMSVHFWGESPFGIWSIEVENEGRASATLVEWTLTVYGTKNPPEERNLNTTPVPELNKVKGRLQQTVNGFQSDAFPLIDVDIKKDIEPVSIAEENFPPALRLTDEDSKRACEIGFYSWEDQCVKTCPNLTHAVNHTKLGGFLVGVCAPCHYSCLVCSGPSDAECESCHPDSQIKLTFIPGQRKPEKHCYPNELAKELVIYEKWSIGVELALAVNLALVVALVVYMLCSKKGCDLSCLPNYCRDSLEWQSQQFENAQQGNYRLLVSQPNVHDAPQHVNTEVER